MSAFQQPGPAKPRITVFTASFDSDCPTCFGVVAEGEEAAYLPGEDEPSCVECVEEYRNGE